MRRSCGQAVALPALGWKPGRMTPRKPRNHDAITLAEAAQLLGVSEIRVSALRRDGLLVRLEGYPSYSRTDVQEFIDNPWINGGQAAVVLGVSHSRVSQLADDERIPVHHTRAGRRVYRLKQLEVVANARALKFHTPDPYAAIIHHRPSHGAEAFAPDGSWVSDR